MKKRKLNSVTLIIILISVFMVILDGGIGAFFTIKSINDTKILVQGKMLDLACSAAYMLDGEELKELTEDDYKNKTTIYVNAYETLDGFKTSNSRNSAEFAYIYLLKQVDEDTFIFTVDVDKEAPAEYGRETVYTKALAEAGKGTPAFDDYAYIDDWGEYYSAYCPVFSDDGKVVAIVACDCSAAWYHKEVATNVASIIILTGVSTVISISLALLINSRIRRKFNILVRDTNELQADVDSLIDNIHMPEEFIIDEEVKPEHKDDQILELRGRVNLMQKELRKYLEYTKTLAYIDPLTGMGNRTSYIERIKQFDNDLSEESILTLIVFDINGLKTINDTYGHDIGDKSIIAAGNAIKAVFGSKVSYRIGGDEMVVIIENNNEDDIKELINRFESNLVTFNARKELPFELALAKGYAIFNYEIDSSFKDLFNRADGSMYQNKNDFYDSDKSK